MAHGQSCSDSRFSSVLRRNQTSEDEGRGRARQGRARSEKREGEQGAEQAHLMGEEDEEDSVLSCNMYT